MSHLLLAVEVRAATRSARNSPPVAEEGGSAEPTSSLPPDGQVKSQPEHSARSRKIGLFGARKTAHELNDEVDRLTAVLQEQQEQLDEAHSRMAELGLLDVLELDRERDHVKRVLVETEAEIQRRKLEAVKTSAELDAAHAQKLAELDEQLTQRMAQLRAVEDSIAKTEDAAILQEVGLYDYRHPLTDAAAYQAELARITDQIKAMARRDGGAITAAVSWTVNNSQAQGRAMVRDISKLMLRAYNAEADNLVRGLKPYKISAAIDRLDKTAKAIERLGKTMSISVTPAYHRLRIKELELTADYLEKVAEDKERSRQEAARLRDERKAQVEIEREKARLEKERNHYVNALAQVERAGDPEAIARLTEQIAEIDRGIADVDYRAANIRAGYVYVISNLGSFGERMVKIGMTRRLEPRDRIRELSDASVPFNFDIHALFFSNDAVGIEASMHRTFAGQAVNRVNRRREFFYVTPGQARDALLELTGDLLEFTEAPEAIEFRQSSHEAAAGA